MADDRSSKRLKPTSRAAASGEGSKYDHARIVSLESENHSLLSENARLRQQLQRLQENHDALPVVTPTPTPTVDISRLDTGLVTHISSFVGTSLELLNLALTCKSFGWQLPGLNSSLVERVARQTVRSGRNDIEGVRMSGMSLPQYARGRTTWLSILHESEHPLKFDTLLGRGIKHSNERRSSVKASSVQGFNTVTAVASNYVMLSGVHYAEFQINAGGPHIGILRPMPSLDPDRFANDRFSSFTTKFYDQFLAARTHEWGTGNVHTCHYNTRFGGTSWTNWDDEAQYGVVWDGNQ